MGFKVRDNINDLVIRIEIMKIIYEKMLDIIIDSIFKEIFLHIFMLLHVFIKFGAAMVDMIFEFCIFMYYFCISDFAIFRVFFWN